MPLTPRMTRDCAPALAEMGPAVVSELLTPAGPHPSITLSPHPLQCIIAPLSSPIQAHPIHPPNTPPLIPPAPGRTPPPHSPRHPSPAAPHHLRTPACCPWLAAGVLLCLRPYAVAHLHRACLVTPQGDYCLGRFSTDAFATPITPEELTIPARATITALLDSPPACGFLPNPRPPGRHLAAHLSPAVPPSPPHPFSALIFPPFPVTLPPNLYRPPSLSAVLAATPASEPRLLVRARSPGVRSQKLVRPRPTPHPAFPSPNHHHQRPPPP